MVKGISRQVIVVQSPDQKMFEQAIFILKDGQSGVTDDVLLKEAKKLIGISRETKKRKLWLYGPIWAAMGALLVGLAWLISTLAQKGFL